MSDYTSGSINFAGLGNGTDFNTLIDGLVDAERYTIKRYTSWKQSWEDKNSQFQELNTRLLSLKTTLEGMDSMNEFLTKNVTSTADSSVSASANSEALEGSYAIEVNQLAKNDIFVQAGGVASLDSDVTNAPGASFSFSYAGKQITIDNIASGASLQTLVNIINASPDAKNKVRASTIFDGTNYHLQLTGMDLGADSQIVLGSNSGFVSGFAASDFSNTQDAQNSQIKVNNFPSGSSWIERPTNTVNDVLGGLTLNLKDVTYGNSIQLSVSTDLESVKENVRTFVDQMNEIRTFIKSLTKVEVKDDQASGSILTGNYGVDIIDQRLKSITADLGVGFQLLTKNADGTTTGDTYSSLAQIGILTEAADGSAFSGLLTLDEDRLDEVLNDDPEAVAKLFSAHYEGESLSPDFSYLSHIDGTTKAGVYDVSFTTDATGKIAAATINGVDVSANIDGDTITGPAGTDFAGLALRLDNNTPNSTFKGKVSLKTGKTTELAEELKSLTSTVDGPLKILQDNYDDIMKGIDDKITREEDRIARLERTLRDKFSRLDSLLGQYDLMGTQLASQISQLSNNS